MQASEVKLAEAARVIIAGLTNSLSHT